MVVIRKGRSNVKDSMFADDENLYLFTEGKNKTSQEYVQCKSKRQGKSFKGSLFLPPGAKLIASDFGD